MSIKYGIVLIEGDYTSNIDDIFKVFNYLPVKGDYLKANLDSVAISFVKGWTIILDRNMLICINDENDNLYKKISSDYRVKIFTMYTYDVVGLYQFSIYNKGQTIRDYYICDGIIEKNIGNPLPIELQMENKHVICEDDIFAIMKTITGIGITDISNSSGFSIKRYNDMQ